MGREVRRVPPNWKHPERDDYRGGPQPMYDKTFAAAVAEWKAGYAAWERGERSEGCSESVRSMEFWEWHGPPPDREYHRPWADDEATWWQLWETVSEGTPVSPPFATKDELIAYLAERGDFWDQKRGDGGWGIERARAFIDAGWSPSLVVLGGKVLESRDIPLAIKETEE